MMESESFPARLGAGANNNALAHLLHSHPTDVHNGDGKLRPVKMSRDEDTRAPSAASAANSSTPAGFVTGMHQNHIPATRPDARTAPISRSFPTSRESASRNFASSALLQLCDATEVHGRVNLERDASNNAAVSTELSSTSHASPNPPKAAQAGPQPASAAAADSSNLAASTKPELDPYQQQSYQPYFSSVTSMSSATAASKSVQYSLQPPVVAPPAVDHQGWPRVHSQDSNSSAATDRVFTPPASDGDMSIGYDNTQGSSQDSQLFQLSQIASLQDKMDDAPSPVSRKRTADGQVKTAELSSTSPVRKGHSRNTSTVSMASTSGSRFGDVSSDLKTRLSYAMLKVNHGWEANSIEEVESMASQASPTSSSSTIPRRLESSASPALSQSVPKPNNATPPASQLQSPHDAVWGDGRRHDAPTDALATSAHAALGPPAPIQPSSTLLQANGRNARTNYTPTLLSQARSASPRTPGQSYPPQSSRDQDAIEALMFMSSPGNSANLKHAFSPAASPQSSSLKPSGARHALPTSQPRKSLPTGRPVPKRVGFEKSPASGFRGDEMDLDSPHVGSPHAKGTPRRRPNGTGHGPAGSLGGQTSSFLNQMSWPTAPAPSQPRLRLSDEDIDRMLKKAAQDDSSDDEGEIQLPLKVGHGQSSK